MARTFPLSTSPSRRATPVRPALRSSTLLAVLTCLALSLPLLSPSAFADGDPLQHRKHKVHRSIQHAQGDVEESSNALTHAQARLNAAEARLSDARKTLAGTRARLATARAEDHRMQARLKEAVDALNRAQTAVEKSKAGVAAQRRQIGLLAAQNYEYGSPQLLGLVAMLGSGDPRDVTTQMNTVHALASREKSTFDGLRVEEARLTDEEAKVEAAKNDVAAKRADAARNLTRKKMIKAAAAKQRSQVAGLVRSRAHVRAEAARIKARDLRILKRLQRRENRIKQRILARAHHQKSRYVGNTSGLLYRPVPGYITSPYGWRKHPIYGYWGLHDGDDFHAPCGTPERAADGGTVISQYYSSVWGNRLYLDLGKINGHNFTVIYNHIERYAVGRGARVARGQTVAYAGTTGWSTGCHLHFTVMRDGVAVDPMDYM